MSNLTDEEITTGRKVLGVIMVLSLIYLVASASGIIPPSANIFEWMKTQQPTQYTNGIGYVLGFNDTVNVTAQQNNSYEITIGCNESYVGDFDVVIIPDTHFDDTDVYWTATTTNWFISDDGLTAEYMGSPLTMGIEITELIFHVDGIDEDGSITVNVVSRIGTILPDIIEIEVIV